MMPLANGFGTIQLNNWITNWQLMFAKVPVIGLLDPDQILYPVKFG